MSELRIAIIFVNFGPYHFARAQALAGMNSISPVFIQLVQSIFTHPWRVPEKYRSSVKLITLSERARRQRDYLHLARRLTTVLNDINPAIVLTSSYRPLVMLVAARWARSRGKRAVLLFENTRRDRRRYWPVEAFKRSIIRRYYDAAFGTGHFHREYLVQLGLLPCRIWGPYDVVDNDHFASKARLVRDAPERWREVRDLPRHYFLYVGRFSAEKNLCRLLCAYKLYRINCAAPWSLLLVGGGPQRSKLESLVASSKLEGVTLRPFAQYDELPAYYALAGSLVLPSTSEPWGLVVNEAMACGLPVMVSRLCGCAPELVQEYENGFCFDPYDIGSISNTFRRISALDATTLERMGEKSRAIVSRFTPRTWAEGLVQCLQTIATNTAS